MFATANLFAVMSIMVLDAEFRAGGTCHCMICDNVVYALKQKFAEEGVGPCEEMGLVPISELFTTDGG